MFSDSAAKSRETATPADGSELAEGLMLLRASTLKIIRLQLAIERNDRRLVLEAVDNLVALDRRLQDCIEAVSGTADQLMFRHELECERSTLNEEKLTLAAEVLRRPSSKVEKADVMELSDQVERDPGWVDHADVHSGNHEKRWSRWWLTLLPVLLFASAAAIYLLSAPEGFAWLSRFMEAAR